MLRLRDIRRHSKAHPKTWLVKRVLLSVLVVGGLSTFTIAGTFASLTSESSNRAGSVASGTLALSDTVGAGTTCFSYTSSTNSGGCSSLVTTGSVQYPGGTVVTANVAIKNEGSIGASNLALYMPSCSKTTTAGATVVGGGNPCTIVANGLALYVEEATSSSFTAATSACKFPIASASPCTATAGSFAYLAGKTTSSTAFSLAEGLTAGTTRYYIVGFQLPTAADNTLQGEQANFDLTWLASQ
jgi:hypothetical protein